jgi:hypothetical protein
MEHNKAPDQDGFLAEFHLNFCDIIRADLLELCSFLHGGHRELFRLNFDEIFLLPKVSDVERI